MKIAEPSNIVRLGLMSTGGITAGLDITCVAEVCPVREVSPLLATGPGLLGAIALRGDPVPLLDLRALAGLSPAPAAPGIAVIAVRDGRRIALGFDAIEGLIQLPRARLGTFADGGESFITGTFEHYGRIVSLVEPRALLARGDIPAAAAMTGAGAAGHVPTRSCLTFEAGGVRFAMAATCIEATVPRQRIEPHELASGAWLGLIRHHGRRIPVMHLNVVVGLGAIEELQMAEVIILRFPDDRLVGFAVEAIRRMRLIARSSEEPPPPLLADRATGIAAILPDGAEPDTYLVDVDALRSEPSLLGIAALSERDAPAKQPSAVETAGAATAERERYVVARAGSRIAIPIRQVARIVTLPERVSPMPRAQDHVRGLFRTDGATVPLIDLGHRLGHGATAGGERARVLLAGTRDAPLGFAVESVDYLEWSAWRSRDQADDPLLAGKVSLPRLGPHNVLPVVDLERFDPRVAARVFPHHS
jgi:purine-binding chemotaxis protein CheW